MHDVPLDESAEEIKLFRQKSTPLPDPWYKRYPLDYQRGTRRLSLAARGAYSDIIDLIFMEGGPIPDDNRWIACALHITGRQWLKVREELFAAGKLIVRDGGITNTRAEEELTSRQTARSGRPARTTPRTVLGPSLNRKSASFAPKVGPANGTFCNEINGGKTTDPESESDTEKKDKDDHRRASAENVVQFPLTEVVDPVGLREDQFERYHRLGNVWGRKPSLMATLCPVPREETDRNLRSATRIFDGTAPDIVLEAIDTTLNAMDAKYADECAKGALKGSGSFASCASYFGQTLRSRVDRIRMDRAKLAAEARTEEALQHASFKKRMDGLSKAKPASRSGRSSLDDLADAAWGSN